MGGAATVGRLVVTVSGDVDQLKIDMREAQAITGSATKEIVNGLQGITEATYTRNAAGQRMVAALREEIATFGMSSDELKVYKASLLGVEDEVRKLIDQTNAMKSAQAAFTQEAAAANSAFKSHGAAANEAGSHVEEFGFKTASAKRELLVLAHELSQGNYKRFGGSMLVLGEQTGAAGLLFSAAGLAAIGMGAAIIGVAVAMEKGAAEQQAMNNALILTGNYSGQTSDSLNALAHAAVATGGSIGEAKKAVTQLAESGKFTGDQLGIITEAVVAMEHATGASIEETIKQFESLSVQAQGHSARASTAISQATVKLDEQYHFLTLSVYDQITALEKEGDLKAASKVATEEFARVTKERAEQIIGNLGGVASAWRAVKDIIGGATDSVMEWGKKSTAASEVERLRKGLAHPELIPGVFNEASQEEAVAQYTRELATAQAELNRVNKIASGQAAETLAQSNAVQAAQRVDAMLLRAQTKEQGALTTALNEYHESLDRIRAGSATEDIDPRLTDKAIKAGEAALTKLHSQAVKGNDDRASRLQDALTLEQTALDREKSIYDARGKMLDIYHKSFGMSDADYYAGEETRRADYIAAEAIAFAKESALIKGSAANNPEEVAARKQKYDALLKQHLDFVDKMNASAGQDGIASLAAIEKQYQDIIKAIQADGTAEDRRLTNAIEKQREHNAEIGKTKEQIELAKRAAEDLGTVQMQSDADFIRDGLTKWNLDAESLAAYKMRLSFLDGEIEKRKTLSGLLTVGAGLEAGVADAATAAAASKKLADMAIQDWQRAGTSIADSLTKAFGSGGKAMGDMFKAYATNSANQLRLDKEMALAKVKLDSDPTKLKEIDNIQRQSAQAQLKSYGDMADAAEGFFDKGSKGYAAMHAASQVMHAAELAMNLASIAPAMAAGAAQFFAESGWGGFAGVAAMTAAVAAFGVAVGGSGSGPGQSAADVQKTQGTGSVFGDATAKSASIAHSIALVAANSSIELTHTAGMLTALQGIQASMAGLTNLIVRTPGATDGSNMGIQTGTLSTGPGGLVGKLTDALSSAPLVGGLIGKLASLWGSTKQNITDSGFQFGGNVRALQAGQGYNQYANVETTSSSWFGLSKHTNNSVQTQGIGDELSSQFGLVFTNLEKSLKTAAVGLGGSADQVGSALDHLTLNTEKISLKGLTGDALTSAINGVISKAMDDMAEAAMPGYDRFRKVGEGYAETVTRVSTDFQNVGSIFESMGKSLVSTTTSTSVDFSNVIGGWMGKVIGAVASGVAANLPKVSALSVDARERLVDLAGGIDKMASAANSFNSNFLSKAEQLAPVTKYVSDQMAALGYSSVTTRDQFKDLVLGLDVTTQKGAEQYTSLMALADAFAKTHEATVDLSKTTQEIADERKGLQDQLDQLTMTQTQLLTKQRNALDAANRPLFDMVQAAQKLADTSSNMTKFRDAAQSLHDGLLTGSLSTLTPEQQYAELRRQYEKTKSAALGGDVTAQGNLAAALNSFLTASQKINGGDSQYAQDFAMGQQDSAGMAQWASGQVDSAQAQLAAMNTTNSILTDISKGITNLPAAIASTPAVVMPAPALNYSTMGAANTEALVTEVKALRTEVAGLRADQNNQTGTSMTANDQSNQSNARVIVSGVTAAIRAAAIERQGEFN